LTQSVGKGGGCDALEQFARGKERKGGKGKGKGKGGKKIVIIAFFAIVHECRIDIGLTKGGREVARENVDHESRLLRSSMPSPKLAATRYPLAKTFSATSPRWLPRAAAAERAKKMGRNPATR
jgi:hypothetical protein